MNFLQKLFWEKPYLTWFVRDKDSLSRESKLENLFNYGSWQDYLQTERELGIKQIKSVLKISKERNELI